MARAHPSLRGPHRDPHFIWNMDQMPVYFLYHRSRTLAKRGIKTVHVRKSTSDTRRATCALTCTAAGQFLRPMLIYKGKAMGKIATTEFQTYPTTHHYRCQKKAWMDEQVMLDWVDEVLAPYIATAPEHVIPVLVLDSYRCHMMASVVSRIQELGVEVMHIPGGCTSLCQPVDVGFNKPFKDRVRRQWVSWMINEGIIHGTTSPPTRRDVAEWVDWAVAEMRSEGTICRNAWQKTGYEWFVNEGVNN